MISLCNEDAGEIETEEQERARLTLDDLLKVFEKNYVDGNRMRIEILNELWPRGFIPVDPFRWADYAEDIIRSCKRANITEEELAQWALRDEERTRLFEDYLPTVKLILKYRRVLTGYESDATGRNILQTRYAGIWHT
ncbi:hypothetical protein [Microvirga sp. VF16]|uniref:hypothetical protein n=1 Tax=Microvirga sp. VF16 TaxID=2807101 RepID=UPI00193CD791|nr:hypothetical protein [Microvirga sp. VF16]QRM34500.1 hypothetical protein JO965_35530 [Microvirga sp. VF16]